MFANLNGNLDNSLTFKFVVEPANATIKRWILNYFVKLQFKDLKK